MTSPPPPESGADQEVTAPSGPTPKKRKLFGILPRPVWHLGRLLILALLIEYLVLPQLAGPRKLITLLDQVNPLLLLAGIALEFGALLSYGMLTRAVLPQSSQVGFFTIFRIQLTTLSVSHCARIGSAVVLNLLLWLALVISIPVWGFSPEYLLAALVGGVLLTAAGALVYALTRGEDRIAAMLERVAAHIPFVDGPALRRSYGQLGEHLAGLGQRREAMVRAIVWATLNWLLDAASLLVFVGAFGHWVNPDGLLVAYGLANVLAAIPLTPGGLGVVEATLTTLLVGFGTARGIATLGVVVYRLFQFWAPIPLGGLAYLSLQASRHHTGRPRRDGLNPVNMTFGAEEPHAQAN